MKANTPAKKSAKEGAKRIRQSDIARALRAAKSAGLEIAGYEIDRQGKVSVFTTTAKATSGSDDLDRELVEFEARHGDH